MKKRMKTSTALIMLLLMGLGTLMTGCGEKTGVTADQAKVTLCSYEGIPVEISDPAVTDEEVNSYAQTVLYYYNQQQKSDRTVIEDNDTVSATVNFFDKDGNPIDDGSNNTGFIYIGSESTYPELEQGLIGAEVGKETEISITLPDPYELNEELSGKTITAKVTPEYIKETEELAVDTLTDEQAALVMDGVSTTDEFFKRIRVILTEERDANTRQEAYNVICEYLLENCQVKPFPDADLKVRADESMEQAKYTCETYYNITFEEYLDSLGHTEEEYRKDIEATLSDTIKLELIFTAIGDKEGIQYDEEEFQAYVEGVLEQSDYGTAEDFYADYGEDYVKMAFRIEYIVDWLIDHADLSYNVNELNPADGAR